MAETYAAERKGAKADIEAAGAVGYLLRGATQHPCSFLILQFTASQIDGALIQHGDLKLMVAAEGLSIVPDMEQDRIIIADSRANHAASNGNYRMTFSNPFMPGGVPIYYDMGARL